MVDRFEKAVYISDIIDPSDVDNGIKVFIGLPKDIEAGYGGGDQGPRIGQVHMAFNKMCGLFSTFLRNGLTQDVPVHADVAVNHCLLIFLRSDCEGGCSRKAEAASYSGDASR